MGESSQESSGLVHEESLLDLLMRQQHRGEQGVRLSFHQELLSAVGFNASPYHYCAVAGETELAVYLYSKGIEMCSNITVASFSAAGTNGNTPWKKIIMITPHEAALLAGNHRVARALKLMETSVPLMWTRQNHASLPSEFKKKVKTWMEGLVESDWFLMLPGPARVLVVDQVMNDLFHSIVWSCVAKHAWTQKWGVTLGEELLAAADELPGRLQEIPKSVTGPQFPQYQFRVAQDQGGQRLQRFGRFVTPLKRASMGFAWWLLQNKCGGQVPLAGAVGTFVASGFHPVLEKAPLLLAALSHLPKRN